MNRRQFMLFGGSVVATGLLQRRGLGQSPNFLSSHLKQITLKLETPGGSGSGVIVHKSGNSYDFLTAAHVLNDIIYGEESYAITSDQKVHRISSGTSRTKVNDDIGIASFRSLDQYIVAKLGNASSLQQFATIHVAGFPISNESPQILISSGEITIIDDRPDGYAFGYNARTELGMSGGPVVDLKGQLIGIHGRADGYWDGDIRVKTGSNWALPIIKGSEPFSFTDYVELEPITTEPKPGPQIEYRTNIKGL